MHIESATKSHHSDLLDRGVAEIIDRSNLEAKLQSGRSLRIKLGIDPTSPHIHLGRSIPLLKLRDFQRLGHKIILIIGDFTGVIGDTSDKESERPMLTDDIVRTNLKTYIDQASKLIDIDQAEICFNSHWLNPLGYSEIGRQADVFSLNAFISRENIQKRLATGKRVSVRELLYPLLQGYDSVHVKADVEIGGTDQRFNLLAGRDLQRFYGQVPQDILTNPIVPGLDGRKMSSSLGNTINLTDSPNAMFGKIMSITDALIIPYFTLLTRVDMNDVTRYAAELTTGTNPRDIKVQLAVEIVSMYHGADAAIQAQAYFVNTFTMKQIPETIPTFLPTHPDIISVLVESELVSSKSEARRVLKQNGIKVDGVVVTAENTVLSPGSVLQKGKIHFIKIGDALAPS